MDKIKVFYEDQYSAANSFGLHILVCQLVLDLKEMPDCPWTVSKQGIVGHPAKGDSKLLKILQGNVGKMSGSYRNLFSVFDNDKLHKLIDVEFADCRKKKATAILNSIEDHENLEIVIVRENTESLLEAISNSSVPHGIKEERFAEALGKDQLARDSVFVQCVQLPRQTRLLLADEMPDIRRLAEKIAAVYKADQG